MLYCAKFSNHITITICNATNSNITSAISVPSGLKTCAGGGQWWNNTAIHFLRSGDVEITFIFVAQYNKSESINCIQDRNVCIVLLTQL